MSLQWSMSLSLIKCMFPKTNLDKQTPNKQQTNKHPHKQQTNKQHLESVWKDWFLYQGINRKFYNTWFPFPVWYAAEYWSVKVYKRWRQDGWLWHDSPTIDLELLFGCTISQIEKWDTYLTNNALKLKHHKNEKIAGVLTPKTDVKKRRPLATLPVNINSWKFSVDLATLKTKQNKTKQNKTKQNKTKQNKTKQKQTNKQKTNKKWKQKEQTLKQKNYPADITNSDTKS